MVLLGIEAMSWKWQHILMLHRAQVIHWDLQAVQIELCALAPAKQPYLPPPLPQAECWEVVESGPWRGVTSAPEGVCKNSAVEVLSDSWLSYCLSSHPAVASLLIASLCSPCTTITGLFNIQALEFNYPPPLFKITWHTSALLVWPGFYKTTDVPILIIHAMVITWWLQM